MEWGNGSGGMGSAGLLACFPSAGLSAGQPSDSVAASAKFKQVLSCFTLYTAATSLALHLQERRWHEAASATCLSSR